MGPSYISDLESARLLFAPLVAARHEICGLAYLSDDRRLLGMRFTTSQAFAQAQIPIRAIATDALALNAVTIVMAHNHPSGDPRPSDDDVSITRRLANAFDALGIRLVEHFVLATGGCTSLRDVGVL